MSIGQFQFWTPAIFDSESVNLSMKDKNPYAVK